ncbi:hypothetical protein [Desulfosporosinus sp. OT]|uniref:hypothetical protein n=1 Tax=Desulfosporosinus sp. OT TaxID=913865 RepID=UPI00031C8465|nr:hypothetical protein [Desulfosporosinus sp. OT]
MSADDKALRNSTGLVQGWTDAAVPEDTVFARISLLAGRQGAAHLQKAQRF